MIVRTAFLAAGLAASLTASSGVAAEPIFIEPNVLRPSAISVDAEGRVELVNRSGLPVHVRFFDRSGEQHHVIEQGTGYGRPSIGAAAIRSSCTSRMGSAPTYTG